MITIAHHFLLFAITWELFTALRRHNRRMVAMTWTDFYFVVQILLASLARGLQQMTSSLLYLPDQQTLMRWCEHDEVTRSRVQRLP